MLDTIIDYAVQHPEQIGGLVTGLGATAVHYQRTGRLPIGRLPYRAARDVIAEIRAEHFGRKRPRGVPAIVVDAEPAAVEDVLREHHFEDTDFDYKYEAEQWSLRRPEGESPHPETGVPTARELHPRAFETTDGRTLVLAHLEASRYEAMSAHTNGSMLSWPGGQGRMATVFRNDTDLDFETVESERSADIEVV